MSPFTKEYRRTCERCGTEWYIPKAASKERAPSKIERIGARTEQVGATMATFGLGGRKQRGKIDRLDERERRVIGNSRCPSCGSVSFRQERA